MVMVRVEMEGCGVLLQAVAFWGMLQPQVQACGLWSARPSASDPFGISNPDHHGSRISNWNGRAGHGLPALQPPVVPLYRS